MPFVYYWALVKVITNTLVKQCNVNSLTEDILKANTSTDISRIVSVCVTKSTSQLQNDRRHEEAINC